MVANKLKEIVEINDRIHESAKTQYAGGLTLYPIKEHVSLIKSRLRLARAQEQPESILKELRNIVAAHKAHLQVAETRFDAGRLSSLGLDKIRVAILKAEIRLLKAQQP